MSGLPSSQALAKLVSGVTEMMFGLAFALAPPSECGVPWGNAPPWRTVMLPIPGTSRVEHLEENVAAAGLELEEREFQAIGA